MTKKIHKTNRLHLRNWQERDLDSFFRIFSLHEVVDNLGGQPAKDIDSAARALEFYTHRPSAFAIIKSETDQIIGHIGYSNVDYDKEIPKENQYDFGYSLHPDEWGKGYATEVTKWLIKYLFETQFAKLIWVGHFDFNKASENVILKSGFTYHHQTDITLSHLNDLKTKKKYYTLDAATYQKCKTSVER